MKVHIWFKNPFVVLSFLLQIRVKPVLLELYSEEWTKPVISKLEEASGKELFE